MKKNKAPAIKSWGYLPGLNKMKFKIKFLVKSVFVNRSVRPFDTLRANGLKNPLVVSLSNHFNGFFSFMTGSLLILFCTQSLLCDVPFLDPSAKHGKKVVMINPAGHAGDAGRKLKDSVERTETLKFAQYLQQELENKNDDLRVILTRTAGQEKVPFQDASFANRLSVDLFLSFHFYSEDSEKPKIYTYFYVSDPIVDFARRNISELNLISVLQAHQFSIHKTKNIAERIQYGLSSYGNRELFDFGELLGIPVKPLLGIASPAVLFEIGWPHGDCQNSKEIADVIIARIDELL